MRNPIQQLITTLYPLNFHKCQRTYRLHGHWSNLIRFTHHPAMSCTYFEISSLLFQLPLQFLSLVLRGWLDFILQLRLSELKFVERLSYPAFRQTSQLPSSFLFKSRPTGAPNWPICCYVHSYEPKNLPLSCITEVHVIICYNQQQSHTGSNRIPTQHFRQLINESLAWTSEPNSDNETT
jgi:hypothetical protein